MTNTEMQNQQNQQGEQQFIGDQSSVDSSFFEQMGGLSGVSASALSYDVTTQVIQSYFDTIEAQSRQARRMSELWAQSLTLQQTTHLVAQAVAPVVSKQVIGYLRQNPEWAKQLIQQELRNITTRVAPGTHRSRPSLTGGGRLCRQRTLR